MLHRDVEIDFRDGSHIKVHERIAVAFPAEAQVCHARVGERDDFRRGADGLAVTGNLFGARENFCADGVGYNLDFGNHALQLE